jgi:hypothetical protein
MHGSGLRLAPRAVSPWGGPAARLLGCGLLWCRVSQQLCESRRWLDGVCPDTTARLCNDCGLMYVGLSGLALLVLTTFHLTPIPFPH